MTLGQVLEPINKIFGGLTNGELVFKEEDGGGDPLGNLPHTC